MLPFMREQGHESSAMQKPSANNNRTPADITGNSKKIQHEEYLTVAAQKKQVRKGTYMLAVLFCIGLLCLLFMIKKSTPQTAAAANTEEAQIEAAITQLTGVRAEIFSRMDELVKKFYEFSDVQQVKTSQLVKNPFKTETYLGDLKIATHPEEKEFDTNNETSEQAMQLLSIIHSRQGYCCMIDDKILYVGDSIRGFKVRQIGDNFVRLELESKGGSGHSEPPPENLETQITLKLSE